MTLDPLVEGQSEGVVVIAVVDGYDHNMDLPRDMVVFPGNAVAVRSTVHGNADDPNVLVKTGHPMVGVAILR
jgi:hypothetical protein